MTGIGRVCRDCLGGPLDSHADIRQHTPFVTKPEYNWKGMTAARYDHDIRDRKLVNKVDTGSPVYHDRKRVSVMVNGMNRAV